VAHPTPLSPKEEHDTLAAVTSDKRIKPIVAGRHARVLVGALDAGHGRPADQHQAVVAYFDYITGRSVAAVVDLDTSKVVDGDESPVQLQLSAAEAATAERIAGADPAIKTFLNGRPLDPLTRLYFPAWAGRFDPPHRFAVVFARPSKHERRYAIVDLTDEVVIEALAPDDIKSQ
jgi:hypothetical protein